MLTKSPAPVLPPPQTSSSLVGWLRANLFSTWYNTLLTLGLVAGFALAARPIWHWVFSVAHWQAVTINLRLFMVGLYPGEQVWRPGVLLILLAWLQRRGHFEALGPVKV